jgi:hypothetical protein
MRPHRATAPAETSQGGIGARERRAWSAHSFAAVDTFTSHSALSVAFGHGTACGAGFGYGRAKTKTRVHSQTPAMRLRPKAPRAPVSVRAKNKSALAARVCRASGPAPPPPALTGNMRPRCWHSGHRRAGAVSFLRAGIGGAEVSSERKKQTTSPARRRPLKRLQPPACPHSPTAAPKAKPGRRLFVRKAGAGPRPKAPVRATAKATAKAKAKQAALRAAAEGVHLSVDTSATPL